MNMKAIVDGIKILTAETLEKSNKIYPLFRNLHEAYAVIKEEFEEAEEAGKSAKDSFETIWENTREDEISNGIISAKRMSTALEFQIAELIQTLAMCNKLIDSEKEIEKFFEKTHKNIKEKLND